LYYAPDTVMIAILSSMGWTGRAAHMGVF